MPISIRSCRSGLLGGLLAGLLGACTTAMAPSPTPEPDDQAALSRHAGTAMAPAAMAPSPPPEPDGSFERPYLHLRQAAVHVVETARSALAGRGEPSGTTPLVTVHYDKAVSPELINAVRDVFSGAGVRQGASGPWLAAVLGAQNRQQSPAYTPVPRAGLKPADFVLAFDEAQAASGLTLVHGALLTLQAGPEREHGAGEVLSGSATSVYVQTPDTAGLVVRGVGFCNKDDYPRERWEYSAVEAARVNAIVNLAQAGGYGATVPDIIRNISGGKLEEDKVTIKFGEGTTVPRVVTLREHFVHDDEICRAVVTVTDSEASPGQRHDEDHKWFSNLRTLFSLVSIFL